MSTSYMHIGEDIDVDRYVICDYRVTTERSMEKAANSIAAEQSTGTWTDLTTTTQKIVDNYGAKVLSIDKDMTRIAYPVEDFSIEVLLASLTMLDVRQRVCVWFLPNDLP